MQRALVLAGGGVAGIAWELGVLRGIGDIAPGLLTRLRQADVVVGTSAGSPVAAHALSRAVGEHICDALVRRSDTAAVDLIGLAAEWDSTGHEVVYGAKPDNFMGAALHELLDSAYGENAPPLRPLLRPDAGGISISKAQRLLGWKPMHSWRERLGS